MNATEHIVELYYRFVQKCFTISDVKIPNGNNRQFDLLALKPEKKNTQLFHIEIGITNDEHWTVGLDNLKKTFGYKFTGNPKEKETTGNKTDKAKGKNYLKPISDVYERYGFKYEEVVRVYCLWYFKFTNDEYNLWRKEVAKDLKVEENKIILLSFRETVLPELLKEVKTNYYDDDLLRTLSLLRQSEIETSTTFNSVPANSGIEKYFGTIDDVLKVAEIDTIIYDK